MTSQPIIRPFIGRVRPARAGSCAEAAPARPSQALTPSPSATPTDGKVEKSVESIVHDPDATLAGVRLERRGRGYAVTSGWILNGRRQVRTVTASSDDGFATATCEIVPTRLRFSEVPPPWPDQIGDAGDRRVVVTFDSVHIELPPGVGQLALDHRNGSASYQAGL